MELQDFYGVVNNGTQEISLLNYDNKDIVEYWGTNKKIWFSHTVFKILSFSTIHKPKHPTRKIVFNDKLNLILYYDQIYRHDFDDKTINNKLNKNRHIAYKFATSIALNIINAEFEIFKNVELWKQVFILLTIRHNNNLKLKYFVLNKIKYLIETCIKNNNPIPSLYIRFLTATILDINNMKIKNGFDEFNINNTYINKKYIFEKYKDILDDECYILSERKQAESCQILNNYIKNGVQNDIKDKIKNINICHKAIKHKLQYLLNVFKNKLGVETLKKTKTIALSISGGVDSMVCSVLLKILSIEYGFNFICLHICYNNRECVNKELEFIYDWCKYYLDTKLFIRNIDEIERMRNTKFRACYEDITRKIRFSFYKYFNCPVILGHNLDDCYENAFSNLSKGIHFNNLFGMETTTCESDVIIKRPLLKISKVEIIDFARTFQIPHLLDSTPLWSRRGKTRNELMENIHKFDPNILKGLRLYIENTNLMCDNWQILFNTWSNNVFEKKYIDTYRENDNNPNITIKKDNFFLTNYIHVNFWVQLWFKLNLETRPSNKSFQNIIRNIEEDKYIKSNLNSSFIISNYKDKIEIINISI